MKKLILTILVSILCIILNATSILVSSESNNGLNREISFEENIIDKNQGTIYVEYPVENPSKELWKKSYLENTRKDLIPNRPVLLDTVEEEATINIYYLQVPPIDNKNYFSYRGSNTLEPSNNLMNILKDNKSIDSLYILINGLLREYQTMNDIKIYSYNQEIEKFQRKKKIEAKAYLLWPFFVIICLISLFKYQDKRNVRHFFTLLLIASLIFTLIKLPDIFMLIKGYEYSMISGIWK